MRWVTYVSPDDGAERAGVLDGDTIRGLDTTLLDLLVADDLAAAGDRVRTRPRETVATRDAALRAPLPRPPSVRDFLSFEKHMVNVLRARLRGPEPSWYDQPVFYFGNPASIHGPTTDVRIFPGSDAFDYEVEVCAVVGRAGSDLSPDTAADHIAGFTVFCDWSARDLQGAESALGLGPGKGKDGAISLGPVLVTPDELEPYRRDRGYDLAMSASVNGTPQGGGNWADIAWTFGDMLAHASRGTTLVPGDVIGSGAVGTGCLLELRALHGSRAHPWLAPGDVVEVAVAELGAVTARVTDPGSNG